MLATQLFVKLHERQNLQCAYNQNNWLSGKIFSRKTIKWRISISTTTSCFTWPSLFQSIPFSLWSIFIFEAWRFLIFFIVPAAVTFRTRPRSIFKKISTSNNKKRGSCKSYHPIKMQLNKHRSSSTLKLTSNIWSGIRLFEM